MRNRKLIVLTCIILVLSLLAITGCGGGNDAPAPANGNGNDGVDRTGELTFDDAQINWTMQTIWVPSITLWRGDKYFVDLVNRLAIGDLYIDYNEGGSLVTTSDEAFDAVRTGSLDMATDWPSYWEGRDTAFGLVTSTPMLLAPGDYMLWYWQAGGLELTQQLYDEYDIIWYPHYVNTPEAGQRTNVPITEPEDYAGLRLRQCGRMQAEILEGMGAGAIFMPGADIYLSLDRGVIDGAEFSVPEVDWSMNFHEVTSYLVTPGWHQPGPVGGVMINKDSYNALPDRVKFIFKEAAMATMMWTWTYFEYASIEYQERFNEAGIEVSRLSDEVLSDLQELSFDMIMEDSRDNPNFAKLAFSQIKYLYEFQEWRDIQSPFMHGRNPEGIDEAYEEIVQIAQDHGVYDEVIEMEASVRDRMKAQELWQPGTPYELNPIAQ